MRQLTMQDINGSRQYETAVEESGPRINRNIWHRYGTAIVTGILAIGPLMIPAYADTYTKDVPTDPFESIKDIREDKSKLTFTKGDFVIVPLPLSDPTLGTGLVLGSAYFYPQTDEQKESQPASLTGIAGVYTNNDSYAYGISQKNYWGGDKWRFSGVAGHLDFKLSLLDPTNNNDKFDWLIEGNFFYTVLSRRIFADWYVGVLSRYVDNTQKFSFNIDQLDFDIKTDLTSVGLGANLEFDTRDAPTNPYSGRWFEFSALFNEEVAGGDDRYQTYEAAYRSYHQLSDPLVLAWEVKGCKKSGTVPLWDACRVGLRGFAATDYLSRGSVSGQVEARWRFWKKIGVVGFAGLGFSETAYSDAGGDVSIPTYGVGLRYMVMEAKRINLRLDYARSDDSDAWYLAVTEAF